MAVKAVNTRLRDIDAPLPQYLLSRSVAGTTHKDIIEGIRSITQGEIVGRFFHMYPERDFDLSSWLRYWLVKGAVPLTTLNCQKACLDDGTIPDAWHHQAVCGISKSGVHLANPNEVLPFNVTSKQLCSESVLLIRRQDILQRWSNGMDFSCWSSHDRISGWTRLKCREQIDRMVKEETLLLLHGRKLKHRELLTTHITIPAMYKSGITLFALRGTEAHELLQQAQELPVRDADDPVHVQSSCNEKTLSVNV